MIDRIIALIALACFIFAISVIPLWVPEPDLIIIISICLAMAIYDFYRMLVIVPRQKAMEMKKNM